jgi:DNA-binding SARP family transcriptional activator
VGVEYRLLGPLEAVDSGRLLKLGGLRPRGVLAILLLHAGQVVPASKLIDEVWGDDPPETAANLLQGYVSQLRKELGRDAIATREPGYVLWADREALDLHRFERLAADGTAALGANQADDASRLLREALALWRGPALADVAEEGVARAAASRLDELRLLAVERRVEADLACARHAEVVGEVETLVAEYPLRERPRALHMLALYRCGRQADALAAYRAARATLVEELGIEPSASLQDLERAILRQDPELGLESSRQRDAAPAAHVILVAALSADAAADLVALAAPLAVVSDRELVLVAPVTHAAALPEAALLLRNLREGLVERGIAARAAAFTSVTPGADLGRLATEQEANLLLVNAPDGLLEDARLLVLLDDAPCDVGVVVGAGAVEGPVLVPFTGVENDWSAVELGAWMSRAAQTPLRLAGASTGIAGRDSSRLLASASLAVQRVLGVDTEPLLVDPTPEALVAAAADAGAVVVGLTDRWRREGLGRARTALATAGGRPTVLVRRGLRPGGLAPRDSDTRFTWTIGPAVL